MGTTATTTSTTTRQQARRRIRGDWIDCLVAGRGSLDDRSFCYWLGGCRGIRFSQSEGTGPGEEQAGLGPRGSSGTKMVVLVRTGTVMAPSLYEMQRHAHSLAFFMLGRTPCRW